MFITKLQCKHFTSQGKGEGAQTGAYGSVSQITGSVHESITSELKQSMEKNNELIFCLRALLLWKTVFFAHLFSGI